MKIVVDNKGFNIDGQRLIYDLYYFDSEQYHAPTLAATFKKILVKWANVLRVSNADIGPLFLLFAPDDQGTECLKAVQHENRVVLRHVWVAVSGYQIDFEQIEDFMTSTHIVKKEDPEELGNYDKDDFISALINAQVVDEK
jgi:hypothetical protein